MKVFFPLNSNNIKGIFRKGQMTHGIIRYSTGAKFQGKFDKKMNYQSGIFCFKDGDFFRGNWKKGVITNGCYWQPNMQKQYPLNKDKDLVVYNSYKDQYKV